MNGIKRGRMHHKNIDSLVGEVNRRKKRISMLFFHPYTVSNVKRKGTMYGAEKNDLHR